MRTFYLIRHGKVAVPKGICYGQSDVGLVESPLILASELKKILPEKYSLWTSPLSRCHLLAKKLGEPNLEARLKEMSFGDWEMRHFDQIERYQIDEWAVTPLDYCPPNGESVRTMQKRVLEALAEIQDMKENKHIVIISHAGPIRIMWGALLNKAAEEWLYKPLNYGEVLRIETGVLD